MCRLLAGTFCYGVDKDLHVDYKIHQTVGVLFGSTTHGTCPWILYLPRHVPSMHVRADVCDSSDYQSVCCDRAMHSKC